MIFNKKIVIGGIVGFSVVTATTVTLIVVLNKKEDEKESKVVIDISSLRASSYEVTGLSGGGTLAKKSVVSLPLQVEVKYAKGLSAPTLDNQYSTNLPVNLSNGDKVFIKFFIKLAHTASHKFPTVFANPIEFGVTGLATSLVSASDLSTAIAKFDDFSSTDTVASGTNDFTLLSVGSADVKTKFIAITSYNAPSLETGVSIHKVIIKTAYSSATNQVVFTITLQKEGATGVINNLKDVTVTFAKITIDTSNLSTSSYEVIGDNGAGAFAKKDGVSLPSQVEAKYAKSLSLPISDSDYSLTFPIGLNNDDKVFIKFFIKLAYTASHKFPTAFANPVEFEVADLETSPVSSFDLSTAIAKFSDFSSIDTVASGENDFTSLSAGSADVIAKFIAITDYSAPSLEIGVSISKVIIKTAYSSATNQVVFTITLQKEGIAGVTNNSKDITVTFAKITIDTSNLISLSYEVIGPNGAGTFAKKDDVSLPSQVIDKYAKGSSPPTSNSEYSLTLPTDIANDDKVFIKFFIKLAHTASHKFPTAFTNLVEFEVADLETPLVPASDLSTAIANFNDFSSTDTVANGTNDFTSLPIGRDDVKTQFVTIVDYNDPSLEIGVSIHKVIIKTAYSSATNQVVFTITLQKAGAAGVTNNLKDVTVTFAKITIDTSNLISSSYEVTGDDGAGTFVKKDEVSLPLQVEAKYAKGLSTPTLDNQYSTSLPIGLANGDKVFIKFFIKLAYTTSYKFSTTAFTNPVEFEVTGLEPPPISHSDLSTEIAIFNDFSSTSTAAGGANDFTLLLVGVADVKTQFVAITDYSEPSLGANVSIRKVYH